ncbi:uncharacterized protein G2W53_017432 [Senna tora]|uniref:Uncharacterized protein n=1 Tax=Senna tora TaxID=362788 RepID=A0A834TPX8_9FABA|nr:uncharacterized protein G2W53_017432 [Senna tora]
MGFSRLLTQIASVLTPKGRSGSYKPRDYQPSNQKNTEKGR